MKNKLILFTLVLALILSIVTVPNTDKAKAAETLPSYDYMILANATYKSSKNSTLVSELAAAQKGINAAETFSNKAENRMTSSWSKYSYRADSTSGFQASSYYNPTRKEIVIAFRGTNSLMEDWFETKDKKKKASLSTLMNRKSHNQKKLAEEYTRKIMGGIGKDKYQDPKTKTQKTISPDAKIVMAGHSLGGYLVQVAGTHMITNTSYAKKFKAGYTFNTLGLAPVDMGNTQWNQRNNSKFSKFAHFITTPELAGVYNTASGRVVLGPKTNRVYAGVGRYWTAVQGHSYKSLYRFFKWE